MMASQISANTSEAKPRAPERLSLNEQEKQTKKQANKQLPAKKPTKQQTNKQTGKWIEDISNRFSPALREHLRAFISCRASNPL